LSHTQAAAVVAAAAVAAAAAVEVVEAAAAARYRARLGLARLRVARWLNRD